MTLPNTNACGISQSQLNYPITDKSYSDINYKVGNILKKQYTKLQDRQHSF